MRRVKTTLFIINSLTFGGAEKQTIDLVNGLADQGYRVGVVYLDPVETLLGSLHSNRLAICRCLDRKGKFDPALPGRLKKLVKELNVGLLLCVNEYAFLYGLACRSLYRRKPPFKLVTSIHSTGYMNVTIWDTIKSRLYRSLLNRNDHIVFVSKNQMTHWVSVLGVRQSISLVIHNGIDYDRFSDGFSTIIKNSYRQFHGFASDDFVVGICARIRPGKNHGDFIEAIDRCLAKGFRVKGLIIGDGPLRSSIEEVIHSRQLDSDIRITGYQEDVRLPMGICDCLAMTSRSLETFSISVLEGMAMSKPMIITDIGGANEQVEHCRTGFLYEKGDINALADCLEKLILDKGLKNKIGSHARDAVITKFSIGSMVGQYIKLLSLDRLY